MAVDSNARSTTWFDKLTNKRGIDFEEFIVSQQLNILNNSNSPTFVSSQGESIIDLSLAGNSILPLTNWSLVDEDMLSDHRAIFLEIQTEQNSCITTDNRLNINKTNWSLFRKNLVENITRLDNINCLDTVEKIENFSNQLTTIIKNAATFSTPRKTIGKRAVPWWNNTLTQMRKQVNRFRRGYQRERNQEIRNIKELEYKSVKKEYTLEIKKTKSNSWKAFCTTKGSQNPWGKIYKIINRNSKNSNILTNVASEFEIKTILENIADLFPQDSPDSDTLKNKQIRNNCKSFDNAVNDFPNITVDELEYALFCMKSKKAPDIDGLYIDFYKNGFSLLQSSLLKLYNAYINLSYFPKEWKIAKVCLIKKPNIACLQNNRLYRPISLLPIGGKILESIIAERLNWLININGWISKNQFGFIQGHSSEEAVFDLCNYIYDGFIKNEFTIAVFLDIKGAFDNAWHPGILHELINLKCPPYIIKFISAYLENRSVIVESQGVTISKYISLALKVVFCHLYYGTFS